MFRLPERFAAIVCVALLAAACGRRERPNVLLVTFDTARADAFGAYGATNASTPAVDAVAAGGVVFEQASTTVPLTLPAHTSLLTGTFPPYHSVRENGTHAAPDELVTMAETFRAAGYRTAAFVGAFVLDARWGLDQGFDTYSGSFDTTSADVFSLADLQRKADRVADDALAWLRKDEKPFFAWVHFYDPHAPYEPPRPWGAGDAARAGYAGEIAFADAQLARLIAETDENTIIVIAADHGEGFGEHGENGHGLLLYEESLHVPLVIRAPGLDPGRVSTPVSLVDVFPTIADLADLETPEPVQGHSLLALARGGGAHETAVYAETMYPRTRFNWSAMRVLRNGSVKLIDSSEPELYDLAADRAERVDLSQGREDLLRRNLRRLEDTATLLSRDAVAARPSGIDAETRAKLGALGYLTGSSTATAAGNESLPSPRRKMGAFNELTVARTALATHQFDEAERRLLELARTEPSMLEAYVALGELYLRWRRPRESVAAFRGALALSAVDPSIIAALATAELQSGNVDEALALVRLAMESSPEEPRFHFVAGRASLAKGDLAAAKRHFDAMLRINPRAAAAMVELAGIAVAENKLELAQKHAREALAIDPLARGARLFLAQALEQSGRRDEAWQLAQVELAKSPDDFRAAFYVAELAARRGDERAIEPNLRRTIELEPRFSKAYLMLATYLLRHNGNPAEGVRLAQKALDLDVAGRDRAHAHFLLADFYSRMGRNDLTRQHVALGRDLLKRTEAPLVQTQ